PHANARVLEEIAVDDRVVVSRLSVRPDLLHPVASLPAQAHGDDREIQITSGLDEVAREDAESAGVDGERFIEAILHAEVSHDAPRGHRLGFRRNGLYDAEAAGSSTTQRTAREHGQVPPTRRSLGNRLVASCGVHSPATTLRRPSA